MVNHGLVRSPEEDLSGKASTDAVRRRGALDSYELQWKLLPARGHIMAVSLAVDDEGFAA